MRDDLRTFLLDAGASEEDVGRAEREGWLPLLVLDRLVIPWRPAYDVAGVAALTDADEGQLRRLWRAVGFPDVPAGLHAFTDADVEAARRLLARGLAQRSDFATVLRQVRVISASMARVGSVVAEDFGEVIHQLREQGFDDEAVADALIADFDGEELAEQIVYLARLQLRAALWLRLARDTTPDLAVAIGFADLAGYTALSAELDAERLAEFVGRWEEAVYETVAQHGARVVKTIGDEAMFAGVSAQVARVALALRDTSRAAGLPPVRAGIAAGMVVARDGDFYGPVVNLASRITEVTPAGSVFASDALHAELASDPMFVWSEATPLSLRSIGAVDVYELQAFG